MIHVLALDDDSDFHELLKIKLPSDQFTLTLVDNEEAFYKKLETVKVDICLLDLSIGENMLKGLEILANLRQEKHNEVPLIVLSNNDSKNIISNALEFGANDFIAKPINGKILIGKIKEVISGEQAYTSRMRAGKIPSNQMSFAVSTRMHLKALTEIGFLIEGSAYVAKGAKIKLSSERIKEIFGVDSIEAYSTGFTSEEESGTYVTGFEINPDNRELLSKAKLWIQQHQK